MHEKLKDILNSQRNFFLTKTTKSIAYRIEQLKKLRSLVEIHEKEIIQALKKDLLKSKMESMVNEVLLVINEIEFVIKNLKKWATPKRVNTPFPALWPGKSEIYAEPYGVTLIIGPWNYPCLLMLSPLIGAIGAGNCAIIKPSEIAIHTNRLLIDLINQHFPANFIFALDASAKEMPDVLKEKFDYIFFTGGTTTGKMVMEAAAKHLTPTTLELGGKTPCIIDKTANLDYAARRIAWAKTLNAGQTCIAPDYLYIHKDCKDEFLIKLQKMFLQFFGENPAKSASYGRIINKKHFNRLLSFLKSGQIIHGGQYNEKELYFAPTLIENITWQDPIMMEEIFGPLLPILTFENIEEVINQIKQQPNPLALYLFTNNKYTEKLVIDSLNFGGGCINDCLLHLVNLNLPFGGIGLSGMGQYRGEFSFLTFSHRKSIYKKFWSFDLKLMYPPYSQKKLWWIKKLLKI